MGTENPPRHSKPTGDPVTIDLTAEPSTAAQAPEESTVTQDSATQDEAGATPAVQTGEAAEPSENPPEGAASPGTESEAARPEPGPAIVRQQPATSILIAAGIFGGLVALAGAGSMQYAGLLPALSSAGSTANGGQGLAVEIETLKERIATLSANASKPGDPALEARLAALEAAAAKPLASAAADAAVSGLEAKLAALTDAVGGLKADLAKTEETQNLSETQISKRLAEAEKKLNEPRDDVEVARAIASAALKTAVDRGGPFLAELDTLTGVAPDEPAIGDLRGFAAAGVFSRAELARQFPDVATAILDAIAQPNAGGLTDRLLTSAMSLVKVRPVGNVVGENPEAIVARMEEKLKNGDLKGAALEWNGLPDAGKAASSKFKAALDDRIRVEELVGATMTKAVSGTGKQG